MFDCTVCNINSPNIFSTTIDQLSFQQFTAFINLPKARIFIWEDLIPYQGAIMGKVAWKITQEVSPIHDNYMDNFEPQGKNIYTELLQTILCLITEN